MEAGMYLISEQRDDLLSLVTSHFQQLAHRRFGDGVISQRHVDFGRCRKDVYLLLINGIYDAIHLFFFSINSIKLMLVILNWIFISMLISSQ